MERRKAAREERRRRREEEDLREFARRHEREQKNFEMMIAGIAAGLSGDK